MNHSPEPLRVMESEEEVYCCDARDLDLADESLSFEQALANAKRIVACVNFCRGFSTELLQKHTLEESGRFQCS